MSKQRGVALLALMALLAAPVWAGSGTIDPGTPAKVNLSVYFDYDEMDPDSWQPLFNAASQLLYNATEKQVQFGKIKFFVNCPSKKDEADIHIRTGNGGASAHVGGMGTNGLHIFLSQAHKSTSGANIGQCGLVHEFGHYAFGLYDEYKGQSNFTLLGSTPILNPAEDFFCAQPNGANPASIMDAGTTVSPANQRPEFCTRTSDGGFNTMHNAGFAKSSTSFLGISFGTIFRTDQQIQHGVSCWEHILSVGASKYGLALTQPAAQPTNDTSGHQAVTFETVDCTPKVVLVIDRSGSMGGTPITLAKSGALSVIDLLEEGSNVGVVSFSSSASVNFPLQEITGDATKDAARAAINAIAASGSTNIGGGLRAGLNQITGFAPRTDNEIIVLLTDGFHNTGEDPSSVLPDIVAEDVQVNAIGLGSSIDVAQLQDISDQTGGNAAFVNEATELAPVIVQQAGVAQGNFVIQSADGTLDPGAQSQQQIFADTFTDELILNLNWNVGELDMTLQNPSGTPVNPGDPGVEFVEGANSEFFRISNPATGNWTVTVAADAANAGPAIFTLQALDESLSVEVASGADSNASTFPEAIRIQTSVVGNGTLVAGADVRATVIRPDNSEVEIQLFDDGAAGHGDDTAGDGVYTNLFSQYTIDGVYTFVVRVNNQNGVTAQGIENDPGFTPEPVAPFTRESRTSVEVNGVPGAITTGTLTFGAGTQLPDEFTVDGDIPDAYMLAFSVTASPDEGISIDSIRFEGQGTGDETRIRQARLYVDSNGDGAIDSVGPTALPAATATFNQDDGVLVFNAPVRVEAGATVNLLLTYDIVRATVLSRAASVHLVAAGTGLALLPLLGLLVRRRKWASALTVVVLLSSCLFLFQACSGNGSQVPESPGGGGGGGAPAQPVNFQATLPANGITATGAVTGQPVTVNGQALQGGVVIVQ